LRPTGSKAERDGHEALLETKVTMTIRANDRIRHITAGGGGFGDPLERDPALVLLDVRSEKLTRDYATRVYGVVVIPDLFEIDNEATRRCRESLRARTVPILTTGTL
jgi:N-methylhydantoinase B